MNHSEQAGKAADVWAQGPKQVFFDHDVHERIDDFKDGYEHGVLDRAQSAAVVAVISAWEEVPGVNPAFHRSMQQRLREEWPVLATALEALVNDRPRCNWSPKDGFACILREGHGGLGHMVADVA